MLRCGGYTYRVETVRRTMNAQQAGLELVSEFGLRPGMKLRRASSPLDNDEVASALMRACQLLHQLAEIDAAGALARLSSSEHDLLNDFLELKRGLDAARTVMGALADVKHVLPTLSDQRHLAGLAHLLSEQLSVIQLANRADIGS